MTSPTPLPEIRYVHMHSGPGSESVWAAAHAWTRLAGGLRTVASRIFRLVTAMTGEHWRGSAANQMRSETDSLIRELRWLADRAAQAATAAISMAEAFDTARAAVVPWAEIMATRLLMEAGPGFQAPRIAAAQSKYEAMWVHDDEVMATYHREVSEAAEQLKQWPRPRRSVSGASTGTQESKPPPAGPEPRKMEVPGPTELYEF